MTFWKQARVHPSINLWIVEQKPLDVFNSCTIVKWGSGGTVVVHVSFITVIRVWFRLPAVIWLKLPWSHVRRVLSSLSPPSIAGFIRVLRFPPVLTLDLSGVALTGPLGRTVDTRTYPLRPGFSVETGAGKLRTLFTWYPNTNPNLNPIPNPTRGNTSTVRIRVTMRVRIRVWTRVWIRVRTASK